VIRDDQTDADWTAAIAYVRERVNGSPEDSWQLRPEDPIADILATVANSLLMMVTDAREASAHQLLDWLESTVVPHAPRRPDPDLRLTNGACAHGRTRARS
jgi:hypothetical protein